MAEERRTSLLGGLNYKDLQMMESLVIRALRYERMRTSISDFEAHDRKIGHMEDLIVKLHYLRQAL